MPIEHSFLNKALQRQRAAHRAHAYPSEAQRRNDLLNLKAFVRDNAEALAQAISADYGHRSRHETLLAYVLPVMHAVDHAL